jgi:hypothetical protein
MAPVPKNGTAEMAPLPEVGGIDGGNIPLSGTVVTIPASINALDRLAAVQFYFSILGCCWTTTPNPSGSV